MFRRTVSVLVAFAAGAAGALPWADEPRRALQVCVCGGPPMCTDNGCYEPLQGQDCDNGSPPEQDLCADCSSCNTGAPTSSRPPSGAPTEYFCYCSTSKPVCIEGGVDACYEPQGGLPCDNGSPPNNQLCDDCVTVCIEDPTPEPSVSPTTATPTTAAPTVPPSPAPSGAPSSNPSPSPSSPPRRRRR